VGSEEGAKCSAVFGRGGVIGAVAASVGGGGGGARSGFRRKKTAGRLTGRARLSVRRRQWGRLVWKGGGREVGHDWAERGRERGGPRLGWKLKMAA
jgi:hypothetical protein